MGLNTIALPASASVCSVTTRSAWMTCSSTPMSRCISPRYLAATPCASSIRTCRPRSKPVPHLKPICAEALLRWLHPERGLVSPLQFIPLAEDTGLILPIGQWVLETACAQIKAWEANPLACELQLAVNVRARQFHQTDFVEQVRAALNKTGANPSRLKLELTESVVLDNINDTIVKMHELKQIGVRFSMDDFGTGYSSLSYLTQLTLDQLKIDLSFVHNIGIKPTDAVIVQTIIGMGNSLGMEVVAEGVENEEQRDFLERNGCHAYQGYLFSKPVPIEEFEALIHVPN